MLGERFFQTVFSQIGKDEGRLITHFQEITETIPKKPDVVTEEDVLAGLTEKQILDLLARPVEDTLPLHHS